jgi:ectoine hydroxylase-related dioxygenase (phytanoyl-CoA dioxygenase family)
MPRDTPTVPTFPSEPGVKQLRSPVWCQPLTASEWLARDPSLPPPETGYRYRFAPHEVDEIQRCHDNHGFCVVSDVLGAAEVAALRADIEAAVPACSVAEGGSAVRHAFVDFSPAARELLSNRRLMMIQCRLLGVTEGVDDEELTVHRSAAIVRTPGAGGTGASSPWHTDYTGDIPLPLDDASKHLNRGEAPNGKWFYLNGAHPTRGGLAVIAESHLRDYEPPPGFRWMDGGRPRSSLQRWRDQDGWVDATQDFDIPGCVPIYSSPADLIIFAARTLHAAFPVPESFEDVRHSVAVGLRSTFRLQVSDCSPKRASEPFLHQ